MTHLHSSISGSLSHARRNSNTNRVQRQIFLPRISTLQCKALFDSYLCFDNVIFVCSMRSLCPTLFSVIVVVIVIVVVDVVPECMRACKCVCVCVSGINSFLSFQAFQQTILSVFLKMHSHQSRVPLDCCFSFVLIFPRHYSSHMNTARRPQRLHPS